MRITLSYFTGGVHICHKNRLLRVDYKERSKPLLWHWSQRSMSNTLSLWWELQILTEGVHILQTYSLSCVDYNESYISFLWPWDQMSRSNTLRICFTARDIFFTEVPVPFLQIAPDCRASSRPRTKLIDWDYCNFRVDRFFGNFRATPRPEAFFQFILRR